MFSGTSPPRIYVPGLYSDVIDTYRWWCCAACQACVELYFYAIVSTSPLISRGIQSLANEAQRSPSGLLQVVTTA